MPRPAEQVHAWLERLRIERAPSPHTLSAYRRDSDKLLAWMRDREIADFAALSPDRMRAFVAAEHRKGLSPTSLQRLLSSCRSLFRQLIREGQLEHDPSAGVRGPKPRRKLQLFVYERRREVPKIVKATLHCSAVSCKHI